MSRPTIRVGPQQLQAASAIPPRFANYCRAATTVIAATLGFGALILTFIAILTLNGMRPALGQPNGTHSLVDSTAKSASAWTSEGPAGYR